MRLVFRPRVLLIVVFAIILVGVATVALQQFLPQGFLQNLLSPAALPDRSEASTAAIMVKRGKIRVGVRQDVSPFGFVDSNGALVGFDIDLAHEFARRWFGDPAAVELVTVSAADRIPRLTAGDVDLLLAAMPDKREREAFIDFSQPYFVDGQSLLVRTNSGLAALSDLNGKRVGALQDSAAVEIIQQLADAQAINGQLSGLPAGPDRVAK
jgi:ABC-type amino acid transport substrate-binding protein